MKKEMEDTEKVYIIHVLLMAIWYAIILRELQELIKDSALYFLSQKMFQ